MKKVIDYFTVYVTMENGDNWATRRHTRNGISEVIQSILKDDKVIRFEVEQKVAA